MTEVAIWVCRKKSNEDFGCWGRDIFCRIDVFRITKYSEH